MRRFLDETDERWGLDLTTLQLMASVASDVTGVSGRAMLAELIKGQTEAATMAELARGRMRSKREALTKALTGRVQEHHRFLLGKRQAEQNKQVDKGQALEQYSPATGTPLLGDGCC